MSENKSYFALINTFDRMAETNYLPASSQLLWYKLLGLFNRSMWAEWIEVDNQRLMALIQCRREASFQEYRNHLIRAGLIEYIKGRKGVVGKYRLTFTSVYNPVSHTVCNGVCDTVYNPVSHTVDTTSSPSVPSEPPEPRKTKTIFSNNGNPASAPDGYGVSLTKADIEFQRAVIACSQAGIVISNANNERDLDYLVGKYTLQWVMEAASRVGDKVKDKQNMAMLKAILKAWGEQGFIDTPGEKPKSKKQAVVGTTGDDFRRLAEELEREQEGEAI